MYVESSCQEYGEERKVIVFQAILLLTQAHGPSQHALEMHFCTGNSAGFHDFEDWRGGIV
jgi:hypothetical protein